MRFAVDSCVAGDVLRTARPERLADAAGRLRFGLSEQTHAQTGLFVPLVFRGRSLGVLAAFDRIQEGPVFTAWDEHVLGAFAASAASAVATAQDVAIDTTRRRIEAQEGERRRWARELHDETLQELAVLKLLAAAALRASSDEERASVLRQIGDSADVATQTLRALITDLRPAALDDSGLAAALDALVERMAHTHDLAIDLDVTGLGRTRADRPPRVIEDTVYRIVQEALANVAKHARADRAQVSVLQSEGAVEIEIRDDGTGFDLELEHAGFGLLGMRERAGLVDGVVTIDSGEGTGTTVRVTVPIARAETRAGLRRAAP
jgi:signal transduction histidine kinase